MLSEFLNFEVAGAGGAFPISAELVRMLVTLVSSYFLASFSAGGGYYERIE